MSKKNQNSVTRPDPLASSEDKNSKAYGLTVAKTIANEWFNGGMIVDGTNFHGRNNWIRTMRLFHRGEQDIQKYKDHVARQKSDLSYLNLDWTPINIVGKFNNIVINGLTDDFYRLDVKSVDRLSLLSKKNSIRNHKKNMLSKAMLEKAKDMGMPDVTHKGFIPEDEEELNLYSEIQERPMHEIAEEILIDFVKKTNKWSYIKRETDKDEVLSGIQIARVYTDSNNGVMTEYVDPENFGHSFVERNDFSDAYYFFVVDTITLADLKRESDFDNATLRSIASKYGNSNSKGDFDNYSSINFDDLLEFKIDVMRYSYKTSKEIVYKKYLDKKNNIKKVAKRDQSFKVPEGAEKSRLSKKLDTWYEGNFVVGSEFVYGWKECENLAKDEMNKVIPPFIVQATNIYKNKLHSFQSDIIPLANQMQYIHLKIQHLMAELKPDLIIINEDHLAELKSDVKGAPKASVWEMALTTLNVKGVIIEKTIDMGEMGVQKGTSVKPQATQQGGALTALFNGWAHYYNQIRETTGINPARDGTASADSLVGVNQMMQLASNTATKHIVDASVAFDKRVCEAISSRVKGVFRFDKKGKVKNLYIQAVGKQNIESIEGLKNRHLHEFGFTIEMVPAKEELDELKVDLSIALQEGSIDVSEKAEIMRIAKSNIKQASQYMRFVRNRRIKEKQKENDHNMKLQNDLNNQSAQAKMQGEIQVYQAKKQIDLQYEVNLSTIELNKKEAELQLTEPYEVKKFEQSVYLEQVKNLQTINLTKYKEDEKTKREVDNSSRQSKMIEQRQKDLPSVDFGNKFNIDDILAS